MGIIQPADMHQDIFDPPLSAHRQEVKEGRECLHACHNAFRIGQAVTAVGAWCAYIAPYVNTLEAHCETTEG